LKTHSNKPTYHHFQFDVRLRFVYNMLGAEKDIVLDCLSRSYS